MHDQDLIRRGAVLGFLQEVQATLDTTGRAALHERVLHCVLALDRVTGPLTGDADLDDATRLLRAWLTGHAPADTPAALQPPWRLYDAGRCILTGSEDEVWDTAVATTDRPVQLEAPHGSTWTLH